MGRGGCVPLKRTSKGQLCSLVPRHVFYTPIVKTPLALGATHQYCCVVPIPDFNAEGNLPPGIHEADWAEFKTRFGTTGHRRHLIKGLEEAMRSLRTAGCSRLYIDGSFVTSEKSPKDFDACWEETGVDPNRLEPVFFDLRPPRAIQKARFGGELFPASAPADGRSMFVDFFQRTRGGQAKGIVTIDLKGWQP
ncbi:DUF6932 family protein [Archangium gephyra]|uniref:DUF6932 family protein n=1 Tax=Archangium gephyra TaxID=48 RepID=UPI003B82C99D